jgi:hypothetical protein
MLDQMSSLRPSWVKYKDMGGPLYRGKKEKGKGFLFEYDPLLPWGVWTQILGVVAECEGRYDTVVMYDNTGVTFGVFQWTFTSGRLQRFLEFMKSIPVYDFVDGIDTTVFENLCTTGGTQVFEDFGFRIKEGFFWAESDGKYQKMNPSITAQKNRIVRICLGEEGGGKKQALDLCRLFAVMGQQPEVQEVQQDYAKLEFKKSLGYHRPPLGKVGGTIRGLLPDELWGTPTPAIFFSLWQNLPGGSYKLFSKAMTRCNKEGLVDFDPSVGFFNVRDPDAITYRVWEELCLTKIADWGFGSKQYIKSGGKNPPRIMRIKPAIEKYYGKVLPWIGK